MTTIDELYKRFYAGETVEARLTDGRLIRDISHNDDGSFYLWTDNGELSSDGERKVIVRSPSPTPTPPTIEPTLSEGEPSGPDEIVPLTSGYALHRYSRFWHLVDAEGTIEVWEDGRPDTVQITHALAALHSEPAPTTTTASPAQPAYTLTEQLEALRKEAHAASRQGLTQVVALLKERACALAESYLDLNCMCDKGHWLNEYGHCETCLEAAQQLACARAHVDATIRRWVFEAETTDCPF